eukprot:6480715-Prymnesium_polylepis.1
MPSLRRPMRPVAAEVAHLLRELRQMRHRRGPVAVGALRGWAAQTGRLPVSPLNDVYPVLEALQGARSAGHRLTAHHRP